MEAVVALLGDLVGSRAVSDRYAVHRRVSAALARVNADTDLVAPLAITAGDEYQGLFATVGAAVAATLRLRLELLPDIDVRHGLGLGAVTVLQESPIVQDGPAWWRAREAIDSVERLAEEAGTSGARTLVAGDQPVVPALNAALLGRDSLVSALDDRGLSVLRGLLSGRTQRDLASELGVSASAVSQRVRRDGVAVVQQIETWLEGVS